MFSSNDLIHLVFANEADTYYCSNLLKLNLHQYLWFKLHEKYSSVYFMSLSEDTFSIKTYGDLSCKAYEPTRKFMKWMGLETEIGELGKWIHKQLTSNRTESAAFVCSLEDFCKSAEYPDWASTLESISKGRNRTGIFVLTVPVSVERSKHLFLHSPVFKQLQEKAVLDVRTGVLRDMYGAIKRDKGEACVFLNAFSRERVYAILLHVTLEQKGRFLAPKDMETVTEYLVRYLASMELQRDCPLFKPQMRSPYMQFQDLYDQLKDEDVWRRLMDRCLKEGGLADDQAGNFEPAIELHITRDRNCCAGKCITLRIPNGIKRLDTGAERAADLLLAIQHELLRPKNQDENEKLLEAAEAFLKGLSVVAQNDLNTYKRILEAIHFCVTWMYVQEQSEEEKQALKIVGFLEGYINISGQCYQLQKAVDRNKHKHASGTLTGISIQQAQDKLAAWEKMLQKSQDIVSASIMNLSMASFSDHIVEQMEELKQEVEKYRSAQNTTGDRAFTKDGTLADPLLDDDRPEDEVGPYTLDAIDYIVTPPI